MESDIVQLGLWGNVVEKNMRVKGTDFENLGFSFELPRSGPPALLEHIV